MTNLSRDKNQAEEVSPNSARIHYITTAHLIHLLDEFYELMWDAIGDIDFIGVLFTDAARNFIMNRFTVLEIPEIRFLTDEERQDFFDYLATSNAEEAIGEFISGAAHNAQEYQTKSLKSIPLEIEESAPDLFDHWKKHRGIRDSVNTESVDEYDSSDVA